VKKVLCILLGLLAPPWIGTVTGLAIYYQLDVCSHSLPGPQVTVVWCLVLPLLLLTTFVHEFGHVIAAWWNGDQIMVVSLFWIALYREEFSGPWRLGRTPRPYAPHGVVSVSRDGAALCRRHLIFILGGAMMNVLTAICCLAVAQAFFSIPDNLVRSRFAFYVPIAFLNPNTLMITLLNLFVIANICCTLVSLVLAKPGAPPSDGTQLRHLLREPHAERDIALSNLHNSLRFGVRPRDWEPSLVAKIQEPGSANTEPQAALFLYYHHEDRGEMPAAERQLLRAVALCGESRPAPSVLAVEAAFVAGLHHRDGAKGREWLTHVKAGAVAAHTRDRAEAAVLLAEGQFSQAIAVAEQGLASSRTSVDLGGAKAERCWLQSILDASRQALEPPAIPARPTPD
jgi:hypothetical protein